MKAITRHNTKDWKGRLGGLFLEYIAGYGIKPLRIIGAMFFIFFIFSIAFSLKLGIVEGLFVSGSAFCTLGADLTQYQDFGNLYKIIYIVESFLGISFTTLFITILARYWFMEE